MDRQDILVLVHLDVLDDDALVDPDQGTPYPGLTHAVLRSLGD
jgi:hypothetical protein